MPIPASLSKLKSLFPVFVVGASVAITIKLLTESTPFTSNLLQVKAEEDIFSPEYQEILEDPKEPEPPTPEPQPEEPPKEQEDKSQDENIDNEESKDADGSEEQDKAKQESPEAPPEQKKEQQPPKAASKLKFRDNDFMGGFLKRIFGSGKN